MLMIFKANGEFVPIPITPEMKQKDILSKVLSVCGPSAFPSIPTPTELVKQLQEYHARKMAQSTPIQPEPQSTPEEPQQEEQPHKQYEKPKRRVKEVTVTDS